VTVTAGLRHEFYGVPWDANGRTAGLVGGSTGLFGISGNSWSDLYRPGEYNGEMTRVQLIGPGSPNPNAKLYSDDWNNFAPAIGVSWSVPYFGQDQTVLRAGYSMGYERNALVLTDIISGDAPGLRNVREFSPVTYQDLSRLSLPLQPLLAPLQTVPFTDRIQVVSAFDNNLRTPYVQNWNLSIQRALPANFTLDVRYVGSKGTKLLRTVNLNEVNIFENGILDAFLTTQRGGNAPLFDFMFEGFDLGLGVINGRTVTGSASLRAYAPTRAYLATNNIGAFASFLNGVSAFGERGGLLRYNFLPENFIVANPQFGAALLTANFANSTYHSLQINAERRFSDFWTLQTNYTWSKSLGEEEGASQGLLNSYRNGRDRRLDKRLLDFHRTHVFRSNGTWELPFGPDRRFLNGARGILSQLVRGWQIGGIFNVFSGVPIGIGAAISSLNQHLDNTATVVGSLPSDTGEVKKLDGQVTYFEGFNQVSDPYIGALTGLQLLNASSTLKALADASGNIIAVNPQPGAVGSLSQTHLEGPGSFRLDVNLLKKIPFAQSKELQLRVEAINLLNTPQFGNPVTDINSLQFGQILFSGGERIMMVSGRFNF
jgi:hypothetical protein